MKEERIITRTVLVSSPDGRSVYHTESVTVTIEWPHGYRQIDEAQSEYVCRGDWTLVPRPWKAPRSGAQE